MIIHPLIDPVAFSLGPITVRWYGIMYLIAFTMAFFLAKFRVKIYKLKWTNEEISDLVFYVALGAILGGRVGYMLFYNFAIVLKDPLEIFKVWHGGMSFHGGVIGVGIAVYLFAKKYHKRFLNVTDFTAPLVPLGLGAGRLGNFINGELWGRETELPWGMMFPMADSVPRHPSQLYELILEGIVLFIIVWWYANKKRGLGAITAVFLIGYSVCRFIVEFFREPDVGIGFIAYNWLTMGQLLSIIMFLVGIGFLIYSRGKNANIS